MKKILFLMIFFLLFCAGCAGTEYDGRAEIERARELHTGRAGASVTMTDDRTGEVVQKLDYLFVGEVMTYMYMGEADGTRYYEFNNGTELNTVTLPDETEWSFIAKGSEGYYSYSKASRHYYADGARLFAVYEAAIDGTERSGNTIRFSYDEAKLSEYAAFAEMGGISDFSMSYSFDEAGYCTKFINAYTMDGTAYSYTVTIEGRDEPVTRTEVFGERAEKDDPPADREVVRMETDRIVYWNLPELTAAADLIVIGEYGKETEQTLEYEYSAEFGKEILTDAVSENVISIKKVLKGELPDEPIKISQRYGILEDRNRLVTFSNMTPMEKGAEWIFFLYYDEIGDTYWCAGDYTGRYPVPNEKILSVCDRIERVTEERDQWLSEKETIPDSLVEEKINDGNYVYANVNGVNYLLTEKADTEKAAAYNERVRALAQELEASEFGVYENLINLELHCDILKRFDCSAAVTIGERAEEAEGAADMTAKAEKTEDSDTVQEEKSPRSIKIFDFGFECVEEYGALDLDLSAVLKGDEKCVGYAKIDSFTVLDIGDGFMWGPDYPLVILSENGTWRIASLPYRGDLHFFIDENRLCIYDSYLQNGFDHFSYYEYDLTEEARTGLYIEVHGLGNEEPYYECDGFEFHSAYEVAEHIAEKTDVLYRLQRYIYENHEIRCGKYYLECDDSQYIEITEGYGFQMRYDFYQDLYERDREYLNFLEENGETEEIGEALSRIRERADRLSAFSYYQLSPNRGDLQPKETSEYIANGGGWTMEMPDENTIRYAEDVLFVYREE